MDIKLKIFCTVAETKSFTKAAKIVHLSQPAVSLQIQTLEEFFETKLFDKTEGAIRLTPAGKILYNNAKDILEHYSDVEKEINKITGMLKGGLTLGASTTLGNYILPNVIIEFKKAYPKVKIKMLVGNTQRIEDLLISGFVDFGFVEGKTSKRNIVSEKILTDQLTLIVHTKHPLARKKTVSVLDLAREPLILREEGSATRKMIEDFFKAHGIGIQDLLIPLVMGSTESKKIAVEAGLGISFVSKWAARKEIEDGRLKNIIIRDEELQRSLSLIFTKKSRLSTASKEFILFVKNYPYENF